jgi:hypothetical protein
VARAAIADVASAAPIQVVVAWVTAQHVVMRSAHEAVVAHRPGEPHAKLCAVRLAGHDPIPQGTADHPADTLRGEQHPRRGRAGPSRCNHHVLAVRRRSKIEDVPAAVPVDGDDAGGPRIADEAIGPLAASHDLDVGERIAPLSRARAVREIDGDGIGRSAEEQLVEPAPPSMTSSPPEGMNGSSPPFPTKRSPPADPMKKSGASPPAKVSNPVAMSVPPPDRWIVAAPPPPACRIIPMGSGKVSKSSPAPPR